MFATKWKLTALVAMAAAVAAGAVLAFSVTAAAQPTTSRQGGGPAFAALQTAADRAGKIAHRASKPADPGSASPESYGVSSATLAAIASCESGGDPTAVSADGTYRGLYQFDEGTWASVGGSGDPAVASPAEQTMRAAMLYARSGSSPWPICGQ